VIARALAAVLIFASVAAASDADVRVDAQRHAAAAGAVGTVTGHAWEERRKPGGVAQPLGGAVVTLVPHSSALTAQLEGSGHVRETRRPPTVRRRERFAWRERRTRKRCGRPGRPTSSGRVSSTPRVVSGWRTCPRAPGS